MMIKFSLTKSLIGSRIGHRRNRRAVSPVISNLILLTAVIVMGLVALAYTNFTSSEYAAQYGRTITQSIDNIREAVSYEYIFYNRVNGQLTTYLMNNGQVSVNFTSITLSNSSWSTTYSVDSVFPIGGGASNSTLGVGQEGYLQLSLPSHLQTTQSYKIKTTTSRGMNIEYTFVA
jgi:hypothetical protein